MVRKRTCLVFALFFLADCSLSFAIKRLKVEIPKSQPIVIKVPQSQWSKKDASLTAKIPIFVLRADEDFIKSERWEDGNLPMLTEFHIEKAQDCGSGIMSGRIVGCPARWSQVELRSTTAWLKVQFPPEISDVDGAIKKVAFLGSVEQFKATNYLHDKVFLPNEAKLFASLPQLDEEARYGFFMKGVDGGFDVSSASFKDVQYLKVDIPSTTTFNTAKVSEDERVAIVIKEQILPRAKELLPYADGKPLGGLAFHLLVPAYNFVTGGESKFDDLLVYLKMEDLKKFYDSDITSQKLIDNSFVLLNNDRVEAKL